MRMARGLLRALVLSATLLALCGRAGSLERKLVDIRFGKVELEEISVEEAVEFLRQESKELDPDHVGVNFLLRAGEKGPGIFKQRKVSLSFVNLPLGEVIRYLCLVAGLQFAVEDAAVVIADEDVAMSKMETRFYQLEAGVIDTKPTRKAKALKWKEK